MTWFFSYCLALYLAAGVLVYNHLWVLAMLRGGKQVIRHWMHTKDIGPEREWIVFVVLHFCGAWIWPYLLLVAGNPYS